MENQVITGETRLVGLLGNPVAHSLSPLIHNHVFKTLGLPLAYVPLEVTGHGLHAAVQALRACGFAGANVTVPHKQAAVSYCDAVSPLSALTGTVNTLYFCNTILHGTTTDWEGFARALSWMGRDPKGQNIVILGNGGTARTFAFALAQQKIPTRLTIAGRDIHRAAGLAAEITSKTSFPVSAELLLSEKMKTVMDECTLCINCTPVGMHPDDSRSPLDKRFLHPGMTVFDTVYNPAQTVLCRDAQEAGCACQGGLRMLLYQGLASAAFWTGRDVPGDIIDINELQAALASKTPRPRGAA